jgi:hypothetical protein
LNVKLMPAQLRWIASVQVQRGLIFHLEVIEAHWAALIVDFLSIPENFVLKSFIALFWLHFKQLDALDCDTDGEGLPEVVFLVLGHLDPFREVNTACITAGVQDGQDEVRVESGVSLLVDTRHSDRVIDSFASRAGELQVLIVEDDPGARLRVIVQRNVGLRARDHVRIRQYAVSVGDVREGEVYRIFSQHVLVIYHRAQLVRASEDFWSTILVVDIFVA